MAGASNLLIRADTESQEKTLSTSIDYSYSFSVVSFLLIKMVPQVEYDSTPSDYESGALTD